MTNAIWDKPITHGHGASYVGGFWIMPGEYVLGIINCLGKEEYIKPLGSYEQAIEAVAEEVEQDREDHEKIGSPLWGEIFILDHQAKREYTFVHDRLYDWERQRRRRRRKR